MHKSLSMRHLGRNAIRRFQVVRDVPCRAFNSASLATKEPPNSSYVQPPISRTFQPVREGVAPAKHPLAEKYDSQTLEALPVNELILLYKKHLTCPVHRTLPTDVVSNILSCIRSHATSIDLQSIVELLELARVSAKVDRPLIGAFQDRVTEHVEELTPSQLASMVFSIGTTKDLDEFWMFIMAKRVQATTNAYTPHELTQITSIYAMATLEDDEFYKAICKQVMDSFDDYTPRQLIIMIDSFAKVRFLDPPFFRRALVTIEGTCRDEYKQLVSSTEQPGRHAVDYHPTPSVKLISYTNGSPLTPQLNDPGAFGGEGEGAKLTAEHVAASIVAAARSDFREFPLSGHWKLLCESIKRQGGLVDPVLYSTLMIPILHLQEWPAISEFIPIWMSSCAEGIRSPAMKGFTKKFIKRRNMLLNATIKVDMLPDILLPPGTLDMLPQMLPDPGQIGSDFNPESSSFHLEVSACLNAIQVKHKKESMAMPFVLDICIPSENLI